MANRLALRGCVRFHLDAHDPASRELGDEVDLVAALVRPQMEQERAGLGKEELAAELLGHERVEDSSQQVSVP